MRDKETEQAEQECLVEKNTVSERDQTLCDYLERSEHRTDEAMLLELVCSGEKEFLSRQGFVN